TANGRLYSRKLTRLPPDGPIVAFVMGAASETGSKKGGPFPDRPFHPQALQDTYETLRSLLELDGAAGFFDLLLDLLGFVLVDAFLDGLRSAFDERLGFTQAQAGDGADFLDDVDLLATVAGENHVELGLLFGSRASSGGAGGRASDRNRRGGRNAPLLFEQLRRLSGLEDGQSRQFVDDFVQVSHFSLLEGQRPKCRAWF